MNRVFFAPALAGALMLTTTVSAQQPFGAAEPVDGAALAIIAGRADTVQEVRAQNSSTVSGNTVAGQSHTGMISFDGQALQGVSGLALLSANTGNNVSINASLNVNVAIRP